MTLAELLEPRGARTQLNPLLPKIGMKEGEYKKHRKEATDELVTKGYLIMPTEREYFRKANLEMVNLLQGMDTEQRILVPLGSPVLFDGESRLSKLPTNKVRRYHNLPEADKNSTLLMLTNEMLKSVGIDGRVIGYDFMNSKGDRNVVQLIDVIRAHEMMEDSYNPSNIHDYSISKDPKKRYSPGMNAEVVNIPSADPDRPDTTYDVFFRHIVMADRLNTKYNGLGRADAALTFDLLADDTSPKDYKIKAGYGRMTKTTGTLLTGDENLLGYTALFGYLAYQKYISETKPNMVVPDIFPKSSKTFRDTYFWPLYNRTLKEEQNPNTGEIRRVPLAMGEIEGLLWGAIGYLNEKRLGKRK